jgi:hypothetical protein
MKNDDIELKSFNIGSPKGNSVEWLKMYYMCRQYPHPKCKKNISSEEELLTLEKNLYNFFTQ